MEILRNVPFQSEEPQKINFKVCFELYGNMELLGTLNFLLEPSDSNALLVIEARLEDERMRYFTQGIPQEMWPEALRSENWHPGFLPFTALSKLGKLKKEDEC
ncbi:MAG: hypothetical protein A4E59_02891 [Syntrophorhabdus sp. PtaB.Bin027]|nr:MAG: hypothetical protein A4E59_02891 [Syntrophorhabdus sp. PtaB.Bin027]